MIELDRDRSWAGGWTGPDRLILCSRGCMHLYPSMPWLRGVASRRARSVGLTYCAGTGTDMARFHTYLPYVLNPPSYLEVHGSTPSPRCYETKHSQEESRTEGARRSQVRCSVSILRYAQAHETRLRYATQLLLCHPARALLPSASSFRFAIPWEQNH